MRRSSSPYNPRASKIHHLLTSATLALAVCGSLPTVNAWSWQGHEIVATIAQIHLHPSVFKSICTILTGQSSGQPPNSTCDLAPVAAWADSYKNKMPWSHDFHYVGGIGDNPPQTCAFPGKNGWAGKRGVNVLEGIRNVTSHLEQWVEDGHQYEQDDSAVAEAGTGLTGNRAMANEALKFLVHFLGDIHQPLHLTGKQQGGNWVIVNWGREQTNLHRLWDSTFVYEAIKFAKQKYNNHTLPVSGIEENLRGQLYDAYIRRIMHEGIMDSWKGELEDWISCPSTSPPPSTQEDADAHLLASSSGLTSYLSWAQRLLASTWNSAVADPKPDSRSTESHVIRGMWHKNADDDILCPQHWASHIHKFNCDFVWPGELALPPYNITGPPTKVNHRHDIPPPFGMKWLNLRTPEYGLAIKKQLIVEKLLAQAGVRLAGILNYLFADLCQGELDCEGDDSLTHRIVGNRGGLFVVRPTVDRLGQ